MVEQALSDAGAVSKRVESVKQAFSHRFFSAYLPAFGLHVIENAPPGTFSAPRIYFGRVEWTPS